MSYEAPKIVKISDPKVVSELLLKKYSADEVHYFYREKMSNPEQYTFYCPVDQFRELLVEFVSLNEQLQC